IAFIDSDDIIKEDMYELMIEKALDYKVNIVNCGYSLYNGVEEKEKLHNYLIGYYDKNRIERIIYPTLIATKNLKSQYPKSICTKLYEKNLLLKNKITFDKSLSIGEDMLFSMESLLEATSLFDMGDKS